MSWREGGGLRLRVYSKAYGAGTRIRPLAKVVRLFEGLKLTSKIDKSHVL